jgi:hypothetical protein
MKIVTASLAALWLCLTFASPVQSADEFRGKWTLAKSRERGSLQLVLKHRNTAGGVSRHGIDWKATSLNALDPHSNGAHEVTFVIESQVGRIECRGYIEGRAGAGAFTFELSRQYLESMRRRGYIGIDEDEQLALAVRDLGSDITSAMAAARY